MPDTCIVSDNRFQSELLALFLLTEAAMSCHIESPVSPGLPGKPPKKSDLILIDGDSISDIEKIAGIYTGPFKQSCIALFNADKNHWIEFKALEYGLHGMFFRDTAPEMLVKGVKKILKGELWFTRKSLASYLSHHDMKTPQKDVKPRLQTKTSEPILNRILTNREVYILRQIATGHTATRIAADLCISPHTVKTHTRNIYKKIQVSSRFEAIRWLSRNA